MVTETLEAAMAMPMAVTTTGNFNIGNLHGNWNGIGSSGSNNGHNNGNYNIDSFNGNVNGNGNL